MKLFRSLLLWTFTLPLCGCIYYAGTNVSNDLAFTITSIGGQTGIPNPQMRVIEGADQFATLLSQTTLGGQVPNPDFTTTTLVAIFSGKNIGCGESLSVSRVEDNGEGIILHAIMSLPGANTACPAIFTESSPYLFVEFGKSDKPVSLLIDVSYF